MFNPTIETLALPKLRQLQSERLQKLILYVYERVPYYKKVLDSKGIKPADIKSIEDIHKLPFTRKTDLRESLSVRAICRPGKRIEANPLLQRHNRKANRCGIYCRRFGYLR